MEIATMTPIFLLMIRRPPRTTFCPYTTIFRSSSKGEIEHTTSQNQKDLKPDSFPLYKNREVQRIKYSFRLHSSSNGSVRVQTPRERCTGDTGRERGACRDTHSRVQNTQIKELEHLERQGRGHENPPGDAASQVQLLRV